MAVFDTIGDTIDGSFSGGGDTLFDVANGGVGFGKLSPNALAGLQDTLGDVADDISAGKIDIPRS